MRGSPATPGWPVGQHDSTPVSALPRASVTPDGPTATRLGRSGASRSCSCPWGARSQSRRAPSPPGLGALYTAAPLQHRCPGPCGADGTTCTSSHQTPSRCASRTAGRPLSKSRGLAASLDRMMRERGGLPSVPEPEPLHRAARDTAERTTRVPRIRDPGLGKFRDYGSGRCLGAVRTASPGSGGALAPGTRRNIGDQRAEGTFQPTGSLQVVRDPPEAMSGTEIKVRPPALRHRWQTNSGK
jgi:hypothetical protein